MLASEGWRLSTFFRVPFYDRRSGIRDVIKAARV